ncbi:MAG: hypothetical protein AAF517_16930, partial [Planctomycetota bacterium]
DQASDEIQKIINRAVIKDIVSVIPEDWLEDESTTEPESASTLEMKTWSPQTAGVAALGPGSVAVQAIFFFAATSQFTGRFVSSQDPL